MEGFCGGPVGKCFFFQESCGAVFHRYGLGAVGMVNGNGDESVRGQMLGKIRMKFPESLPSMRDENHGVRSICWKQRGIKIGIGIDLCGVVQKEGRKPEAFC